MLIVDTRSWAITGSREPEEARCVRRWCFWEVCWGRLHRAELPYPGGCTIGKRPIDLHLKALQQMGVIFGQRKTPW